METLAHLGVVNDGRGLDFFFSKGKTFPIKKPKFDQFAVFAVGAAHATKQVPVSQAIPLLNQVSAPIVLIGGPDDVDRAAQIEKGVCGPILNLAGQISIQESASVIDQADFVMVPDTGMMHISAALKKPIVLFWGSTSEEFGMYPYFGRCDIPVLNVKVNGLKCRPCTKYGKSKCPRGHFKCMLQWNPMEVAEEINSFSEHIQRNLAIH